MDSEYLKQHVGLALSLGLSEICQKRPSDPIGYLSAWLKKYVRNREENEHDLIDKKRLEEEREILAEEAKHKEAMIQEQEKIANQLFAENINKL
ncbi:DPY30 domain-containing protein 1-like [Hydra vulgaris]|uniref:DPY30 domain-containing protein 1-like n=1 Tax=Hydra vulgaris TaxID=6087 RepID=UPI0032E9E468